MSYRITAAAIQGEQLAALPDIMKAAGLDGYGPPDEVASWSEVADEVFDAPISRTAPLAACVAGEWTLILNGEIALALFEGNEALTLLVQSRGLTCFSVVADSTTGMFGYRLTQPRGTRFVFVEGDRVDEFGAALGCEGLIAAAEYSEESLLDVMDFLGVDFEAGLEDAGPVVVYRHA
ncbi:MAG: hypothetical protein U1E63_09390 [Burkholderiales bacterium]